MPEKSPNFDTPLISWMHVPVQERVLDRLADILFASDEILDMIRGDLIGPLEPMSEVGLSVRLVYNQVNDLMKQLTD